MNFMLPWNSRQGGLPERDEHRDVHDHDGHDGQSKGRHEKAEVKSLVIIVDDIKCTDFWSYNYEAN